jgi:hypothetical protein
LIRFRKAAALLLLGTFTGCGNPVDAPLPGATSFKPPAVYQRWWDMVEECSGRSGLLANVSWFATTAAVTSPIDGQSLAGFWTSAGNRIVVAGFAKFDGGTVRHEMLHSLLQNGDHPHSIFLGSCAGVVGCGTVCTDGAPAPVPDPNAVTVFSDAIHVTASIEPASPRVSSGDGFLELIVTATNPANHAVIVSFPTSGTPFSFGYALREASGLGSFGGVVVFDETEKWFAAGETKKHIFDISMMPGFGDITVHAGSYAASGEFAHMQSTPIDVVVRP